MNKTKYVLLLLCLLACIGYFLPAVSVNINVPGFDSSTMRINLGSLFSLVNQSTRAGVGSSSIGSVSSEGIRETIDGVFNLLRQLHLENLVGGLLISIVFYVLVIFVLVVMIILILKDKFNRIFITIASVGVLFYIIIAFHIKNLPSAISEVITKNLSFFSGFIDLSGAINFNINLGIGFWLTFMAIISMLSICLYTFYKNN